MTLFDVIIGQCLPLLKSKLKDLQSWEQMEAGCEVGKLLKEIKSITHQFQANISIYKALDEAKRQYYVFCQNYQHMNTITFMKTLKNIVDVIEFYGGSISSDPALIKYEQDLDAKDGITGVTDEEYETRVRNKMLAVGALRRSDKTMYSHILHDMRNQYQFSNDCYPNNLTKAFDLLQNYHSPTASTGNNTDSTSALQFAQQHAIITPHPKTASFISGTNGKLYAKIKCSHCHNFGHYSNFWPNIHDTNQQHAMMEDIDLDPDSDSDYGSICAEFTYAHQFSEHSNEYQGPILLDSGSSCSVFCDDSLLENITHSEVALKAFTNGGS